MSISVGGIVVIVIFAGCAVVAFYFAIRSYMRMRHDRSPGATEESEAWGSPFWSSRRTKGSRPPDDPRSGR